VRESASIGQALREIAAETGRAFEEVERSWVTEVRRPWIEAGFFVARG
jgi:hypothetical protein